MIFLIKSRHHSEENGELVDRDLLYEVHLLSHWDTTAFVYGSKCSKANVLKRGEEPLNVFVTVNPGSLWAPLPSTPPTFSSCFCIRKAFTYFFFSLKQLHETRDWVSNGYWRQTKTVAAEMKSTRGNWFFCSLGEKQSGFWKKEQSQPLGLWFNVRASDLVLTGYFPCVVWDHAASSFEKCSS